MSIGKAIGIFCDIWSDEIDDHEKATAIYVIMNREKRMGEVPKVAQNEVIKWLWHRAFRIRKSESEISSQSSSSKEPNEAPRKMNRLNWSEFQEIRKEAETE